MGIFSRLGTLIKSNINDLITKAEDPEKMLSQVLLEMQQQLVEAKKAVAVAIADEKKLQKQYTAETDKSKEWERKAMVAVRAGDDNLARQALGRKQEHENIASQFQQQWISQKQAVEKLKGVLATKKGQRFGVAEFKDWTGVSRKYAIPLLEFLDRERITRREGDRRLIL